ncbi:MAG: non-heme iron oxygenase ferredoxin subunit [Chloroflexi bacterium]|nr:non-heme iron oxygenase ferredoxin subunit [Chloroflexota bacterium]
MPKETRVARVGDVPPGQMKLVEVGGEPVVLANVDGQVYAFSDECTHQACPLSEGDLKSDVVECGCHGSQFNVRTGAVVSGPARRPVKSYAVRVQQQDIFVGEG